MADEYWVLGEQGGNDGMLYWDTSVFRTTLFGLSFTFPENSTTYTIIQLDTSRKRIVAKSNNTPSASVHILALSSGAGYAPPNNSPAYSRRLMTIKNIDTSVTNGAYAWLKSATGGKGVKHDFVEDLSKLNSGRYSELSSGVDITTTITAKAGNFAPNSATSNTWRK